MSPPSGNESNDTQKTWACHDITGWAILVFAVMLHDNSGSNQTLTSSPVWEKFQTAKTIKKTGF